MTDIRRLLQEYEDTYGWEYDEEGELGALTELIQEWQRYHEDDGNLPTVGQLEAMADLQARLFGEDGYEWEEATRKAVQTVAEM